MGIQISEIIPRKEVSLKDLKGKTIAIDAYNALYQFLTTIRQPDGTPLMDSNKNITSHLSGLFYRNINLLQEGVRPIYVFDGEIPELKKKEIEHRKELKKQAEAKFQEAKDLEDVEGMKKYSGRFVKITKEIIEQSIELLSAMGIPVIQAPSEGEAEAASLAKDNKVWASASQDYDSLLYATPNLLRNLNSARRKKNSSGFYEEVKIELVEFEKVLSQLQIDRDQLICLAILVGTDYNPGGVRGLGQKKALDVVQRFKYPVDIFKYVEENFEIDFNWHEIFKSFHEYETGHEGEISFKPVNEEKVKEILLRYEFSESRIESGLLKLRKIKESKKQKGLSDFF